MTPFVGRAFRIGEQVESYDPAAKAFVFGRLRGFIGDGATLETRHGELVYVPCTRCDWPRRSTSPIANEG